MPTRPSRFPAEAEIEASAATIREMLGPAVVAAYEELGLDVRQQVRFSPVAKECYRRREAQGLTLKAAAAALKVPQYRLRDVEKAHVERVVPDVLHRYVALLGLEKWFTAWAAAYPPLASALAPPPPRAGRARRPCDDRDGFLTVLRFTVTLAAIDPVVWRRIEVPDWYSFWDLHVALQDAMGWQDTHLHEFTVQRPATAERLRIGIPDDEFPDERPTEPGWHHPLRPFFRLAGDHVRYVYDFGDDWKHTVSFEGTFPREGGTSYPRCLDGGRRCPPEDCGGPPGFIEFLTAVRNPRHPEHAQMLAWAGGSYDPSAFQAEAVRFDDPQRRLRQMLRG